MLVRLTDQQLATLRELVTDARESAQETLTDLQKDEPDEVPAQEAYIAELVELETLLEAHT